MNPLIRPIALVCLALLPALPSLADVSEKLPTKIDPADRWVFYAHSSVVYLKNKTTGWEKKTRAFSGAGYRVITAERFDADEEVAYAENVVSQVRQLLQAGVSPKHIFVGGYSRGAVIALDVAGQLANPDINVFLLAGCKQDEGVAGKVQGRILSLYGTDDEKDYGACQATLGNKTGVSLTEKEYDGKGHKFFSGMSSSWFKPLRDWMKQAK